MRPWKKQLLGHFKILKLYSRAERKSCCTKCVTAWLSEVYKRDSHFQSPIAVVLTAAMSACQVSGEGAVEWTPVVPHHTLQNTAKTNFKSSSHFFFGWRLLEKKSNVIFLEDYFNLKYRCWILKIDISKTVPKIIEHCAPGWGKLISWLRPRSSTIVKRQSVVTHSCAKLAIIILLFSMLLHKGRSWKNIVPYL